MEVTARRRRALSTALALVLAVESVSAVAAAGLRVGIHPGGAASLAAPAAGQATSVASSAEATASDNSALSSRMLSPGNKAPIMPAPVASPSPGAGAAQSPAQPAAVAGQRTRAVDREATGSRAPVARLTPATTAPRKGRNHVWIPSLGISRSVSWFPCNRSRAPDNLVYRWGCAGTNNVYLLGHAYGVFKPLQSAYASGRLRKGMTAYYADSRGKVHTYRVRWWKVTAPTTAASWAWAAQSTPSMTLQTCIGSNGAYRLMVRLVEVRG